MSKENIVIVGAGALGCEILKNLVGLGLGNITIIDDDIIEPSNLHRQLLYKAKDVGKYKAETAAHAVQSINPELKIQYFNEKLSLHTNDIFNDEFWEKQNVIFGAVDSYDARKMIDQFCISYDKIFLDSGTHGLLFNTQVIIPNKTINFDREKPKNNKEFAGCTIKLPTKIEHAIKWAIELFNKIFIEIPNEIKKIFEDSKGYLNIISDYQEKKEYDQILFIGYYLKILQKKSLKNLIAFAINFFQNIFFHEINNFIKLHPENYVCETGKLFWFPPRNFPTPIQFDDSDDLHTNFICCVVKILFKILNISFAFQSDEDLKLEITKEIKINEKENDPHLEKIKWTLENFDSEWIIDLNIIAFDKDDDSLFHVDFVHYASLLRSKIFKLENIEKSETRIIAGNISPAIITSSSCAASLIVFEYFKILLTDTKDISILNDYYGNLGLGKLSLMKLTPPNCIHLNNNEEFMKLKYVNEKISIWDKIIIHSPKTLHEIIMKLENEYKIPVTYVYLNNEESIEILFQLKSHKHESKENIEKWKGNLQKKIEDICEKILNSRKKIFLELKVIGFDKERNDSTYIFPLIKYIL